MLTFSGTDANRAIVAFFGARSAALPDHTRYKLTEALGTTDLLGTIIATMEALYAARGELPEEGIDLLDGLARFVSANNFYGKAHRAAQISGVAIRIVSGGNAEEFGDPITENGFTPQEIVTTAVPPLEVTP
ncbi:MAG: hypothetical protein WC803_08725 [Sphingomonas sp.]|jgi:hypothetical protein